MNIKITEAHLALGSTEDDANRVIEELNRMGYSVEYGTPIQPEEQPWHINQWDWDQAVELSTGKPSTQLGQFMATTKAKLTIPPELEYVKDRGFSYVHFKKLPGEDLPIIVARDLQPEYACLFAAAPELLAACKAAKEYLSRAKYGAELDRLWLKTTAAELERDCEKVIAKAEAK